jgi:hypothetical protein
MPTKADDERLIIGKYQRGVAETAGQDSLLSLSARRLVMVDRSIHQKSKPILSGK